MKTLFTLIALSCSIISQGILPNFNNEKLEKNEITSINDFYLTNKKKIEYYKSLEGKNLKGNEFLSALQEILKVNQVKPDYSGGKYNWYNYLLLDRNFELSPLTEYELNNINSTLESRSSAWWDKTNVYCNVLYEEEPFLFDITKVNKSGYPYKIDREHIYPKSYGFNLNSDGYKDLLAGCDMHNLHMGEARSNQQIHSNLPYGNVLKETQSTTSSLSENFGSKKGTHATYNGEVIEPLTKDKGDIARSIFYMAARYHNYEDGSEYGPNPRLLLSSNPTKPSGTYSPDDTKSQDIAYGVLSDLMEWNELDTVNSHEKLRNELCYKYIQFNRNPFIDYPLWADLAFNPYTTYVLDLTSETGVADSNKKFELKDSSLIKTEYKEGDTIDLSKIEFILTIDEVSETISSDKLKFYILKDSVEKEITTSTYTFEKGECTLKITYGEFGKIFNINVSENIVLIFGIPREQFIILVLIIIAALILIILISTGVIKISKKKKRKALKKN